MKYRLLNEFRALAPYWLFTLVIPFIGWRWGQTIPDEYRRMPDNYQLMIFLWVGLIQFFGFCLMAVIPFGMEFNHGAWNRLLSLPITRKRIWWEKLLVVSLLATTIWIVDLFYIHDIYQTAILRNAYWVYDRENPIVIYKTTLLYGTLLAFFLGICMSLYSRQTHAAFWRTWILAMGTLTLLIPFIIITNEYCPPIKSLIEFISVSRIFVQFYKIFDLEGMLLVYAVPWCWIAYYFARRQYKNLEV